MLKEGRGYLLWEQCLHWVPRVKDRWGHHWPESATHPSGSSISVGGIHTLGVSDRCGGWLAGGSLLTSQKRSLPCKLLSITHSFLVIIKRKTREMWVWRVSKPRRQEEAKDWGRSTMGSSGKDLISCSWLWNTLSSTLHILKFFSKPSSSLIEWCHLSCVFLKPSLTIAYTSLMVIRVYHGVGREREGGRGETRASSPCNQRLLKC